MLRQVYISFGLVATVCPSIYLQLEGEYSDIYLSAAQSAGVVEYTDCIAAEG